MDWVLQRPITDTTVTSIASATPAPSVIALGSVSPNPMQDYSTFSVTAAKHARITVTVADNLGRMVATLYDGEITQGTHTIRFDTDRHAKHFRNGRYFICLYDGREMRTASFILLR